MKALIKEPKKPAVLKELPDDTAGQLSALQDAVGGWIEQVRLSSKLIAIVDEEGRLKSKPYNVFGLVGTVVFCGLGEEDYTDVPQDDPLLMEVI